MSTSPKKPTRLFTCDICGEDFESDRSEGSAEAEATLVWGADYDPKGDNDLACDECFQKIMTYMGKQVGRC